MSFSALNNLGRPIIICSHRRSGTHLTIDLLRKQFAACEAKKKRGKPLNTLYLSLDSLYENHHNRITIDKAIDILYDKERPVIKTHRLSSFLSQPIHPELIDWIKSEGTFIYVVRDVRKVLQSLYLYEQSFNKEAHTSLSEFIRQPSIDSEDFDKVSWWVKHVEDWKDHPKVMILKYEDVLYNTEQTITNLATHLNLQAKFQKPLLPAKITSVWKSRWNRLIRTTPESTAILGNAQKSKGNHTSFTAEDLSYIGKTAGPTMKKLGYEMQVDVLLSD